jgi:hypothetical protein
MVRPTCGGEGEKYYQLITSCYLVLRKVVVFYFVGHDAVFVVIAANNNKYLV